MRSVKCSVLYRKTDVLQLKTNSIKGSMRSLLTRIEKMRCDYAPNASLLPKAHVLIGWYQNHPPSFKHRAKRILPSQKQFSKGEKRRDENRKSKGKLTTMADYGKHGRIWAEKDEEKKGKYQCYMQYNTKCIPDIPEKRRQARLIESLPAPQAAARAA